MKQKIKYSYEKKKAKRRKIFSIIGLILFIFIFVNLMTNYLIFSVRQNSVSMAPDIKEKSMVMICPIVPKINRGDVVYINPKSDVYSTFSPFKKFLNICVSFFTFKQFSLVNDNNFPCSQNELRRVVCMPGDTFYMRDFVLYIKPKGEKHFLTEFELSQKKYNIVFTAVPNGWDSEIGVKGYFESITLKEGEYFVLADNRICCDDSRLTGAITKNDIAGKALFCYFPFTNLKLY